jgi:glycosyltransferase involved in cell wall biosynthesis
VARLRSQLDDEATPWAARPPVDPAWVRSLSVALFSQNMSGGAFGAVFAGLANALVANHVTAIDLLTVQGDMTAAEHAFPATARPLLLPGGGSAGAIPALRRHLETSRPDVLISGPIIPNLAAVAAMGLARRWHGRLILSHHHPVRLARGQSWKNSVLLVRLLYRFAHGSFAVSPQVRDEVIAVAGLDPRRVACIPNVLPPPPDLPASPPPDPWLGAARPRGPVFVTVARLEPVKNHRLLLEAFARIARPLDARLLIIGDGAERAALAAAITTLGLDDHARLLGYVPSPRPHLQAADAFVLASDEEGFGQVFSEAMREGLPVIGTDAAGGGTRFVLDDGRAGVLVPRGDPRAVAEAMTRLADPQVRADYAARARRRAEAFMPGPVGAALVRFLADLPPRR